MRLSILSLFIVLITTSTFLTSCNSPAPTKAPNGTDIIPQETKRKHASQDQLEDKGKKHYAPKELQEDYSILRKTLETTYPSLYRFTDSVTITQYLDEQFKQLDRSMTESEFYKLVTLTCARANDEHVIPKPSKDYFKSLKNSNHYFPFSLKIIDRKFYVLKSASSNTKIPIGSEILSINGRSAEEILNILLPTIPSDGYIQTFNVRHLEDYSMIQERSLFDLNYPIFIEDVDSFKIEFVRPEKESKKEILVVQGLDYKMYQEFYNGRIDYKAPLEFKYLKNDIAYLRIHSFVPWHRNKFKQDFHSLYESIFKELNRKRTENLILDLRNNEGGHEPDLLSYLVTKPYKHWGFIEMKFTGYPPVVEYLENGKDVFYDDSFSYKTPDTRMYRAKKEHSSFVSSIFSFFSGSATLSHPLLNEQKPDQNSYSGKLYVMINGASGSMASVIASFLRENTSAIFIGEESGGTMEGETALRYAHLLLPNTKIRIQIPLWKIGHHVNFEKGRGVLPDYDVIPKIENILKGEDTELNFTLDLITPEK